MKEVALHDRPREKLERLGVSALGDNELLALILGSGSRQADTIGIANRVLASIGGIQALLRTGSGDLCATPGIGRVRAAQLLAAVELGRRTLVRTSVERPRLVTPRDAAAYLLPQYGAHPVERFGIVMLDTKQRVLRVRVLSLGSLDSTVVHPREVFREAASAAAASIILFHNHPSGDPAPSADDITLTMRLVSAGAIMGIDVVDHVILAEQRYYSMIEAGAMGRGR